MFAMTMTLHLQGPVEILSIQLQAAKSRCRRAELVRKLWLSHSTCAIDPISDALEDSGPVALEGINALLAFGEDSRAPLQRIVNENRRGSRSALLVLARLGDEQACERLIREHGRRIDGPLDAVRWLEGCGRMGIAALVRCSLADEPIEPGLRRYITARLAAHRDQSELIVLELARDSDLGTRERALEILAEMPSRFARSTFESLYGDRSRSVQERAHAIRGLANLGCVHRVPELRRIAADKSEGLLREPARKALRRLGAGAR